MLYSSSRLKRNRKLTLEDILNRLSEYDIYAYYMGANFVVGKPMSSPLRRDVNPSFGIFKSDNGALLYKDLGTGDSGNCVNFVQQRLGIPDTKYGYVMALEQIYNDMLNHLTNGYSGIHKLPFVKQLVGRKANGTSIGIKRREWDSDDKAYWRSYHIPTNTLKKFFVFPVQHVFLDDYIAWTHRIGNPIYAYKIYNSFKVYRPFAKTKEKWLSSCGKFDVQGYQQLPKEGDLLIITKSLKDVMVLHEMGYHAVAPHGENHAIPNEIIYNLQKRFKRIVVLYDFDYAGRKGAEKLNNKYKFKLIFVPKEHGVKDISDYTKKHNLTKANELIKNLLNGRR